MTEQRTAYLHSPALANSRAFMGGILTIAVSGESTRGRLTVIEARGRLGNEPPPHVHGWQDEILYLVEGGAEFYCGQDRFVARAGDYVFIPQGVAHAMRFLTPSVRLIAVISSVDERPVEIDRYLLAMSEPATSLELPAPGAAETYATADPAAHAIRVADPGTRVLNPDEARELLPGYPGFGAQRG